MALAPTTKVVLGSIAFGIFWVLAVFPAVPFLPIGRTAGSLLGAMLMVIFQVISPDEAYAAIDLPILGLLFGTMVVSIYLERADMFKYLCKLLSWKSNGGKDLLCRICIISAVSSALFTNDTCCVVLTEFVLKIARQNNLPPQPFLLALASSANIGSSATPIGNPQNLVIAVQSKISFGKFLAGILPAMLVGIVVNAAILLCYFWKYLSNEKDEEAVSAVAEVAAEEDVASHRFSPATMSHLTSMDSEELISTVDAIVQSEAKKRDSGHAEALSNRFASGVSDKQSAASGGAESSGVLSASKEAEGAVGISHGSNDGVSMRRIVQNSVNSNQTNSLREGPALQSSDEMEDSTENWKRLLWKSCVYLVTIGMLVSLLLGLNMSWTALTAALALVVLDFKDAHPCLEKVSYSLLIFFCGMFITVDGFDKTGIPSTLWDFMEPHARINSALGVVILALVILVLSNIASNVPTGNKESFVSLDEGVKSKVKHGAGKFQNTEGKGVIAVMTKGVLLLGARVAASAAQISPAEETKAWLILAWVSTVAGNLTLLGSAANLIVCEQAHRVQYFGYNLSFFSHLRFGLPSTLIVTAIGLLLIRN